MNIEQLSELELKGLAYDTIAKIQVEQSNLALITQMLEKKKEHGGENPTTEPAVN